MSRPTFRQNPTLELLERREVLSGPSADAQYMLELVNLARTNPSAAADRISNTLDANDNATLDYYHVDLKAELRDVAGSTPRQPLAWSDTLATTATNQSIDQINLGLQTHDGADGSNLGTRLTRAGLAQVRNSSENAYAYSNSVDQAMKAFLIDWGVESKGHRKNLLQPGVDSASSFNQVGIGIVASGKKGIGPLVVTQDFARNDAVKPQIVGVVYDDTDKSNFYTPGEGKGGVAIEVANLFTGATTSTETMDAGGYQIPLDPGSYRVTAKINGSPVQSKDVYIGSENIKVDFDLSDTIYAPIPVVVTPPAPPAPPKVVPTIAVSTPTPTQFAAQTLQSPVYQVESNTRPSTPLKVSYQVEQPSTSNSTVDDAVSAKLAPVSVKSSSLTSALFNPMGWITNWTSWKATTATRFIR